MAYVSQVDSLSAIYGVERLGGFEGVGIDRGCHVVLGVRRSSRIKLPRNSQLYSISIGGG